MSECPFHELQTVLVRSAPSVFGCCVCGQSLPPAPAPVPAASPTPACAPSPADADAPSPAPPLIAPSPVAAQPMQPPQQQQQQQTQAQALRGMLLVADNAALPSAKPAVVVLEAGPPTALLPPAGAAAAGSARYAFSVSGRRPGPCLAWTQRRLVLPCRGRIAALAASTVAPVAVVLVNAYVPDGSRAASPTVAAPAPVTPAATGTGTGTATATAPVAPPAAASTEDAGADHSTAAPQQAPQQQDEAGLFPDGASARSCLVVVPLQRDAARERCGADGCVVQAVPLDRCRVLELSFAALGMARQSDADVFVVTGADGSLHLFARSEQQQGHLGEVAVRALLPELAPVQSCARSSPVLCVNVERIGDWRVAACGCANGLLYLAATNVAARANATTTSSSSTPTSAATASPATGAAAASATSGTSGTGGSAPATATSTTPGTSSNNGNNSNGESSSGGTTTGSEGTADRRATLFLDGPVTSISYCPTDKGRSHLLAASVDRAFPLPASLLATAHAVRAAAAAAAAADDPPLYTPQPVVATAASAAASAAAAAAQPAPPLPQRAPSPVAPAAAAAAAPEAAAAAAAEVPAINMVVGGASGHVTVFTDVARCGLAGAVPVALPADADDAAAADDAGAIVSSVVGYRHVDQHSGTASCNVLVAHGRRLLLYRGAGPRDLRLVWSRTHEAPILRVALSDITGDFVPEMVVLTLTACHVLQQTLLFDRLAAAVKHELRQLVHIRELETTLARLEAAAAAASSAAASSGAGSAGVS